MESFAEFFVIAFLLLLPSGSSTVKSSSKGTIVYYDFTPDEVVVAADSRQTRMDDATYSDTQCKIFAFGNESIFANAGVARGDIEVSMRRHLIWDSRDVARRAFANAARMERPQSMARSAAQYWAAEAIRTFQPALSDDPTEFMRRITSSFGGIAEAVFAHVDRRGNISVFDAVVQVTSKEGKEPTVTDAINEIKPKSTNAMGDTTVIQEFEQATSDRSKAELHKWGQSLSRADGEGDRFRELRAIQFTKWAIQYDVTKTLGGEVDALVLNRKGIRWLKKKDSCKDSE